jgi:hypothetical protein
LEKTDATHIERKRPIRSGAMAVIDG